MTPAREPFKCFINCEGQSHFNVSISVTRQCPQTTTFEDKGGTTEADLNRGPSAYQSNALPLGHTGSLSFAISVN